MRVLVRNCGNPNYHDIEVVNAETEERITGVTSLSFSADAAKGNHLVLRLADFDVDIDQEAQVLSAENLTPRSNDEHDVRA